MHAFQTLSLRLTAAKELGFTQTSLFFLYQLGKHTGLWHFLTPQRDWPAWQGELKTSTLLPLPAGGRAALHNPPQTFTAADDLVNGHITLFGALRVPLTLTPPGPLQHWTHHETSQINGQDIKFTWEPARFGWVFPLARAYFYTGDERYPTSFWHSFDEFCAANPPNTGPNWASAQEVGLRLLALTFAHRVFAASPSSTPERMAHLSRAVAPHAARLPPTLLYARAQNNNHLLSEAAALYTAGLTLPDHPQAPHWRALGWKWFHHGLQTQIEPDGNYGQHSTNYHRLMLQLALWMHTLAQNANQPFPSLSLERLAAATHWLLALCDPATGRIPNLGPNDGAYLLPLATLPHHDYRPVLQAASRVFLHQPAFPPGAWDEMSLWFSGQYSTTNHQPPITDHRSPITNIQYPILTSNHSRAYLRTARFHSRPGHADQLHLDLWWRGLNIALDPGTYLYNADPPWDNALTPAFVHNTLTVNGLDQMTRAGRFLYAHRAQATILERTSAHLIAEHDGYRKLGLTHRRTVEITERGWRVTDQLLQVESSRLKVNASASNLEPATCTYRLHWLLPDWKWEIEENTLQIQSPHGWVAIKITQSPSLNYHLFRAGQTLRGATPAHPTWGWYSPTYGVKEPALAWVAMGEGRLPEQVVTEWEFPET